MYGQNNINPMPDFSNYNTWDEYMGKLLQGLIESSKIKTDSTIIEIAPGATSKISQALSNINFSGKLYIIEPHPEVSEIIHQKTKKLLPDAEIVILKENFNKIRIDDDIDAILGNHIFDDFITAYATDDLEKLNLLFQDISKEEHIVLEILKTTWEYLDKNAEKLSLIKKQIKKDWDNFVKYHNPKTTILSQYSSSYFDKNNLNIINKHAKDLFGMIYCEHENLKSKQEIQEILNKNENYKNDWIGNELLNAKNWIIDEK